MGAVALCGFVVRGHALRGTGINVGVSQTVGVGKTAGTYAIGCGCAGSYLVFSPGTLCSAILKRGWVSKTIRFCWTRIALPVASLGTVHLLVRPQWAKQCALLLQNTVTVEFIRTVLANPVGGTGAR